MEGKPSILLHPVGPLDKLDREELDAMARQARKAIGLQVEFGAEIAMPAGAGSGARGQFVAARLLAVVPPIVETAPPQPTTSTYGGLRPSAPAPAPAKAGAPQPFARVAVTDQDLYTPGSDFVFGLADAKGRRAVLSVRRLREPFYRRKADPARHRARAARQFIAAVGSARGLPDCSDPRCVMADIRTVLDVDRKDDRFCGNCNNLIRGRMRW